jgi:hypothetical protein
MRKFNSRPIYIVILFAILLFLFVLTPDSVLYAQKGVHRWLPYFLIFGCIPIVLFQLIKKLNLSAAYIIAALSVFVFGPTFGIHAGKLSRQALEKEGVITQGYISRKWLSNPSKDKEEWLVRAKFKVDGQIYETFTKTDEDNELKIEQSIQIIYSSRNPDINDIYFFFKEEQ